MWTNKKFDKLMLGGLREDCIIRGIMLNALMMLL